MTTVLEALNGAVRTCLTRSEAVYFVGEDVLDPYGGAFKVARGLSTAFPDRVITTPVSEAGIVGLGIGMALRGLRPIVEIMFGDFLTLAADQLINHAAKLRWMSGDRVRVPLVVRTPMGGRRGYGPTHSQTLEKHFLGVPGLRVVAAPSLGDPGVLMQTAVLEDDDPLLWIEHKLQYPLRVQPLGAIPDFAVERQGGRYPTYRLSVDGAPDPVVTLVAYGYMAEVARLAVHRLAYEHEVFAELLIYTQLSPLDPAPLVERLGRTGCLLTVEEGTRAHGWGAEVLARAVEAMGHSLTVGRLGGRELPIPAAETLEAAVLPGVEQVVGAALALVGIPDLRPRIRPGG